MATDWSIPHNGDIEALNEDKFESKRSPSIYHDKEESLF